MMNVIDGGYAAERRAHLASVAGAVSRTGGEVIHCRCQASTTPSCH